MVKTNLKSKLNKNVNKLTKNVNKLTKKSKNISIKASIYDKKGNENIWIKDFKIENMTGRLDNIPLSNKYKLNDLVLLKVKNGYYEVVKKINRKSRKNKKVKNTILLLH